MKERTEEILRQSLLKYRVPYHTHDGIIRYVLFGISPGGFLTAVICNDLTESFGRADEENREALFDIVNWFYNCAPLSCWKSAANMNLWMESLQNKQQETV